jgi:hypothetical protein
MTTAPLIRHWRQTPVVYGIVLLVPLSGSRFDEQRLVGAGPRGYREPLLRLTIL